MAGTTHKVASFKDPNIERQVVELVRGINASNTRSAFRAYQSTAQSIPEATWTKVAYQTERYDQLGEYDPTLYRFTASKAGIYLVSAFLNFANVPDGSHIYLVLYVNGAEHSRIWDSSVGSSGNTGAGGSTILKLDAGNYVEVFTWASVAINSRARSSISFFTVARIA